MALNVVLDLPPYVEARLRAEIKNLDVDVKEAFALELFRKGTLSHAELSEVLGLDRFETDGFLKQHGVFEGSLSMADLDADHRTLQGVLGKGL